MQIDVVRESAPEIGYNPSHLRLIGFMVDLNAGLLPILELIMGLTLFRAYNYKYFHLELIICLAIAAMLSMQSSFLLYMRVNTLPDSPIPHLQALMQLNSDLSSHLPWSESSITLIRNNAS